MGEELFIVNETFMFKKEKLKKRIFNFINSYFIILRLYHTSINTM